MTAMALQAPSATVTVSMGLSSGTLASSPQAKTRPVPVVVTNRFPASWTRVALQMVVMCACCLAVVLPGKAPIGLRGGRQRPGAERREPSRALGSIPMRALILDQPGRVADGPLRLGTVADVVPAPGGLLLRVVACAVCRTDLQIATGDLRARRLPIVPGHQAVGIVEAIGAAV